MTQLTGTQLMRSKKAHAKKANEVKKTVVQDYLKHNQSPPYKKISIAPAIKRDFDHELSQTDRQIQLKERYIIDHMIRKKRNSRIRKRHNTKCYRTVQTPKELSIVLDECMKIDPFYYDPQSFPTEEQYFQLWQV